MSKPLATVAVALAAVLVAVLAPAEHPAQMANLSAARADIDVLGAQVAELEAQVENQAAAIERKDTRIQNGIEWRRNLQRQVYGQNRTIDALRLTLDAQTGPLTLAQQDQLWLAGYRFAGGKSEAQFISTILPCESGNARPSEHTAVGRTDDWGRAQINRPVWSTRMERSFGIAFEAAALDPALNGIMAAIVEQEHQGVTGPGLEAWTCWRIR